MKRLDTFIISKFLQLFAGAFFVCLFVFMMQFTWRYVDDLVGKGLTLDILSQFFGYMALTLVPQSLPLAILLASLITFGNMGENLELLSMKAAGVPLTRIMRPLIIFSFIIAGTSFYFQNATAPDAQKSLRQLLLSMRQSQPAVEIPEGIFYNGVPKVNLYVDKKNTKTGMLYEVIIYKTDLGFDQAQIVLADSGRLEMTADKLHLRLGLWSGTQFQSLAGDNNMQSFQATMPYDRETFCYKEFLIDFDSNFNLLDGDLLGNMPSAKNMQEIVHDADSMSNKLDSAALAYVDMFQQRQMARRTSLTKEDSVRLAKEVKKKPVNIDDIFAQADAEKQARAKSAASMTVQQMQDELTWKNDIRADEEKYIRRHWIEWHTKITLSLACILFFFIGAPLGAIIRKGGLGTPSVISVGIFIFYYIINTSGMKMAREGNINMILGMWTSTFILAPAGVYLTFMSNRDSQVFNIDAYRNFFRRLFGIRTKRNLGRKEVIIEAPDYEAALTSIATLKHDFAALKLSRLRFVNRIRYRKNPALTNAIASLEALIADLANTRDLHILAALNAFPFVSRRRLRKDRRTVLRGLNKLERSVERYLAREQRKLLERSLMDGTAGGPTTAATSEPGAATSGAATSELGAATSEPGAATGGIDAATSTGAAARDEARFTEGAAPVTGAATAATNALQTKAEPGANTTTSDEIFATPVIIGLSDRTDYAAALAAVRTLKAEVERLPISRWGLVNRFRFRGNRHIGTLNQRMAQCAGLFTASTDPIVQRVLTNVPKAERKRIFDSTAAVKRCLERLEQRVAIIVEYKRHNSIND